MLSAKKESFGLPKTRMTLQMKLAGFGLNILLVLLPTKFQCSIVGRFVLLATAKSLSVLL